VAPTLRLSSSSQLAVKCEARHTSEMYRLPMIGTLRATEQKDLPALARFLIRVYKFGSSDYHADTELLKWKYLRPRPGWRGGRSYFLEKEGQIVAHCGVCPAIFQLPNGNAVDSLTLMDWAADYSSPGAGIVLFRKLMEMASTSYIIGGVPAARQIHRRIGFQPVGEAQTYAGWLRPLREFRIRRRTLRSALRVLHGLAHPLRNRSRVTGAWDFTPVDQFDDSLLPILNRAERPWTFCKRTLADLNYLLECPHLKMRGFLLRRHGNVVGYFIIAIAEWEARLLDLMVDSDCTNDWNLACAIVTRAAKLDPDICRIRILATLPLLRQALVRNGYWCQYKEPIVIHDPSRSLDRAFPVSFQLFDNDSGY
jgi:hypothetical protein